MLQCCCKRRQASAGGNSVSSSTCRRSPPVALQRQKVSVEPQMDTDCVEPQMGTDFGGRFRWLDLLSKGGQARVYRCQRLSDKREVVAKVIACEESANEVQEKAFDKEVAALSQLSHINIVEFMGSFELADMRVVVMELVDGRDLSTLTFAARLTEFEAKHVFRQLLEAVGYMHSKCIIHRDLKPRNILTSSLIRESSDGALYHVKLIDFGMSKAETISANGCVASEAIKKLEIGRTFITMGTRGYVAPEASDYIYSFASDYWSLGVTLFCMLCGHHPFDGGEYSSGKGVEEDCIYDVGMFGIKDFTPPEQSCWHKVSEHARNLIARLLTLEYDEWYAPKARYGFFSSCQHPWVCSPEWQPSELCIPRRSVNIEIPLQKLCVTNVRASQCALDSFSLEYLKSIVHICTEDEAKEIGQNVTLSMHDCLYYGERKEVLSLHSANPHARPVLGEFEAMFCDDARHVKQAVLECCRERLLVTAEYDGKPLRDYCAHLLADGPTKWLTVVALARASDSSAILFPISSDILYVGDCLLLLNRVKDFVDDGVPWVHSSIRSRESFSRRLQAGFQYDAIKKFIAWPEDQRLQMPGE